MSQYLVIIAQEDMVFKKRNVCNFDTNFFHTVVVGNMRLCCHLVGARSLIEVM